MSLLKNESSVSECSGCVCDVLKTLEPGTIVRVFNGAQDPLATSSPGDRLQFLCFDPETCIVTFKDDDDTIFILCCEQINAITLVPEDGEPS